MEKIDEALNSVDADEWSAKLNKGKDLFLKRNKHILLITAGIPWPATQQSHWPQIQTTKSVFTRL